ncbi:uncharacterized protein TNCT_22891 [Trichonephila clavata]|uniref:Uncharacterized protein n=1 Tax=Trichonephila clavata TaxID=2740835 RepID=A0A8X6I8U1_TRICU|nr:uncharacterized protein TNCT_22891 [Trichonephila clavata]
MPSDPIFQHLLEVFFPYCCMGALDLHTVFCKDVTPKGPLTKNLLDLIADAFAVLEISIHIAWSKILGNERTVMMQSAQLYVWHIMNMCWGEKQMVIDIYDRTLSVIALVRYMSEIICFNTGKKFYKLNFRILTAFFENCLREDFKKRGGWKRLEKHILNRKYREYYNECATYGFLIDDIPYDLKVRIRHSFTSKSTFRMEVSNDMINDLTQEVMSFVGTSLLNEINSPKTNTEKSVPKEAEGSSSTKDNGLEVSDMLLSSKKQINLCVNHLNQFEEKLKELISIFELLDTK